MTEIEAPVDVPPGSKWTVAHTETLTVPANSEPVSTSVISKRSDSLYLPVVDVTLGGMDSIYVIRGRPADDTYALWYYLRMRALSEDEQQISMRVVNTGFSEREVETALLRRKGVTG